MSNVNTYVQETDNKSKLSQNNEKDTSVTSLIPAGELKSQTGSKECNNIQSKGSLEPKCGLDSVNESLNTSCPSESSNSSSASSSSSGSSPSSDSDSSASI